MRKIDRSSDLDWDMDLDMDEEVGKSRVVLEA